MTFNKLCDRIYKNLSECAFALSLGVDFFGDAMKKEYLECGQICSAHGVRGVLKVEPWCDSPSVLASLKYIYFEKNGSYRQSRVVSASLSGALVLLSLEDVCDRESAQALRGVTVYAHRDDIPVPEGSVLIADMIGLDVIDADSGRVYGTLADVTDGVRHQIYTVKTDKGEVLFPAVSEFLEEIDTERGVFIRPIPGFFDDEV